MSIDRDIAVSYLLGELSSEDRERFELDLASDSELRELVEELKPVVVKLEELPSEAWEAPEPPPLDIARVTSTEDLAPLAEREAEADRAARSLKKPGGNRWFRLSGYLVAGAALLLVGYFIGNSGGGESSPTVEPGPALALESYGEAPPSAEGQVRMVSSTGDQMQLDVTGLKPNPRGEFYELWLLGKDGELVALGSFKVGDEGQRTVELPLPVDPASFQYFDVSIQSDKEGPDHSGRSVLRGLTTGEFQS